MAWAYSHAACHHIALDKDPGVRPICICETAQRIVSKAILHVIRDDIQEITGSIQFCAGKTAGIEAALHTTRLRFSSEETEGVLLVDTKDSAGFALKTLAPCSTFLICMLGYQ